VLHSLLAHLRLQAALEEDTIPIQTLDHTTELHDHLVVVHLTTGQPDQVMVPLAPLRTEEQSHLATILEVHRAGQAQTLQATVHRVDLVLAQAPALQAEAQVDPQAAQAQEDPEEGGINSPFFLRKPSENHENFVSSSTYPF
jgi:hypothetical protein